MPLGIKQFTEDQNRNLVAGEIEQMKSNSSSARCLIRWIWGLVTTALGKILEHEMYRRSPFKARCIGNESLSGSAYFVGFR